MLKNCIRCCQLPTTKNTTLDIYLCNACSQEKEYQLITKTEAKTTYLLTDLDLQSIDPSRQYTRRHFHHKCTMTLYHVVDIENVFCLKHMIDHFSINTKLDDLKTIKETKKKNKINKHAMVISKRREALTNALSDVKLTLREDSQLCSGFIDGSIKTHTLKEVVHRMCQMKYLFDYCNMDDCLQQAYKSQKEERKAGYYPDRSVFEEAEDRALHQRKYPELWPWLETTQKDDV